MFVTNLPCVNCSKLLINLGGVERVYYRKDYRIRDGLLWLSRADIIVGRLTEDCTPQEATREGARIIAELEAR